MKGNLRTITAALMALVGVVWTVDRPAVAQSYPIRSVKIIVPNEAGGVYDLTARLLAKQLSDRLGQTFYVENRVGGGSVLGTQAAASAKPDGYTLLLGGLSNIVFNAALYPKLNYDPMRDFVPVAFVNSFAYVLVARHDFPFADLHAIIEHSRAHPTEIILAHPGAGSAPHILGVALMKTAGVQFLEVPYKGIQAPLMDLIAGRVDLMFASEAAATPYLRAGTVKGLAISGPIRSKVLSDLPTLKEAGVDVKMQAWLGLFAPAHVPDEVLTRLQTTIRAALPDIKRNFQLMGTEEMSLAKDESRVFLKSEFNTWTDFIRTAGIQVK